MSDSPRKAEAIRRAIAATPDDFYLRTEPLTKEQIGQLPDGADVLLLWSGGNGPHQYKVKRQPAGHYVYAAMVNPIGRDAWWNRPIDFVGNDHPFTLVWRLYPVTDAALVTYGAASAKVDIHPLSAIKAALPQVTAAGSWPAMPVTDPSPEIVAIIVAHLKGDRAA